MTKQLLTAMTPIESPELDFSPRKSHAGNIVDQEQEVKKAREALERLQREQAETERQRNELNLLAEKRHAFLLKQSESTELFAKALTEVERELATMRGEIRDLEKIHDCFRHHLVQTESMDIEKWNEEITIGRIDQTSDSLDSLLSDYKEAVLYCTRKMDRTKLFENEKIANGTFLEDSTKRALIQGLTFNLPLVILGIIALIIFIIK